MHVIHMSAMSVYTDTLPRASAQTGSTAGTTRQRSVWLLQGDHHFNEQHISNTLATH